MNDSDENSTGSKPSPDWVAIQRDWVEGALSVRAIARLYGTSDVQVSRRAERESWPARMSQQDRRQHAEALTGEIIPADEAAPLHAFGRVVFLIRDHRALLRRLNGEIALCLEDVAAFRHRQASNGRALTLADSETILGMAATASQALHRLVPLERKAFGLNDSEGVSEFDGFSDAQLYALESHILRVLGRASGGKPDA